MRTTNICSILLAGLVFQALPSEVLHNAGLTGFQLLEEPVNPVSIAMGSAGTALPSRAFAYYNPALPALSRAPYICVEYGGNPTADFSHPQFETAWPFSKWFAGFSLQTGTIDDIIGTDEFGAIGSTFAAQTTHGAITAGFTKNKVSVGLCLNGVQERIGEYVGYAVTFSAGAVYCPIPGKLVFGLSAMHGTGSTTSMLDTVADWGTGARLPKTGRFGASWTDSIKSVGYTVVIDAVFRNSDRRIMIPAGIEIRPFEQVAIRAGKRFNHDTELFNFGGGLTIDPLTLDVSFIVPKLVDDIEIKPQFSITYMLKNRITLKRKNAIEIPKEEAPVIKPAPEAKTDTSSTTDTLSAPTPDGDSNSGAVIHTDNSEEHVAPAGITPEQPAVQQEQINESAGTTSGQE
jgi:hypothetical protein